MDKRVYSLEEARLKIERYCAYQDRCHYEVKEKLFSYGLMADTIDIIMLELLQLDFLNEERFARSYVSGKFKIKRWGKIKIEKKLKEKRVSDRCIQFGMEEIEEAEYSKTLGELMKKKWLAEAKIKKEFDRKGKVVQYLYSRGFESDLIWDKIEEIL